MADRFDVEGLAEQLQSAGAGNSDSIVAFNPGVVPRILSVTPREDYTAGESNDSNRVEMRQQVGR